MYSWLEPGRYTVDAEGRVIKTKSRVLQGWACHYNVVHTNYKTGAREQFLPGCFAGSMTGVFLLRDHKLSESKLADQIDGDLELHDCEAGLAIRIHLKDGVLERLESRDQFSVGYVVQSETVRGDGVRLIKSATLLEVSAVYYGAVRQTFLEIRDAEDVGTLAQDSKSFASEGASRSFLRALRALQ